MFGSGIGELNVYVRTIGGSKPDLKIWSLNGDKGNNWYMAQAPVASSKPFKVKKIIVIAPYETKNLRSAFLSFNYALFFVAVFTHF